jgi:hypothetical protein
MAIIINRIRDALVARSHIQTRILIIPLKLPRLPRPRPIRRLTALPYQAMPTRPARVPRTPPPSPSRTRARIHTHTHTHTHTHRDSFTGSRRCRRRRRNIREHYQFKRTMRPFLIQKTSCRIANQFARIVPGN